VQETASRVASIFGCHRAEVVSEVAPSSAPEVSKVDELSCESLCVKLIARLYE
jgi:hypothetical protein